MHIRPNDDAPRFLCRVGRRLGNRGIAPRVRPHHIRDRGHRRSGRLDREPWKRDGRR